MVVVVGVAVVEVAVTALAVVVVGSGKEIDVVCGR